MIFQYFPFIFPLYFPYLFPSQFQYLFPYLSYDFPIFSFYISFIFPISFPISVPISFPISFLWFSNIFLLYFLYIYNIFSHLSSNIFSHIFPMTSPWFFARRWPFYARPRRHQAGASTARVSTAAPFPSRMMTDIASSESELQEAKRIPG